MVNPGKVIIIGGGISGYNCAIELADAGFKVSVIEKDMIGGTCLHSGCIPAKTFLHKASPGVDITGVNSFSLQNTKKLESFLHHAIKSRGIEVIMDSATVLPGNKVRLEGRKAEVSYDKLILATGSEPVMPGFLAGQKDVITSDDLWSLPETPGDFVILGGGDIGIVAASMFVKFGSRVTVVEKKEHILQEMPEGLGSYIMKSLEKLGVTFITGKAAEKVEDNILILEGGQELLFDKLLVCVGRKCRKIPSLVPLEMEHGFVKVDSCYRTSDKSIYAIGDCTGKMLLAHKAEYDAHRLARHLSGEEMPTEPAIPRCVYSTPFLGVVGSEKGRAVTVPFAGNGRANAEDVTSGFVKIFVDGGRIVGAQALGPRAEDVFSSLVIIVQAGLTCTQVANMMLPHPSYSEIIKDAARLALEERPNGQDIHP